KRPKLVLELIIFLDLLRLNHREPKPGGSPLDRWRGHFHASALRAVGLRYDQLDIETASGKRLQRGNSKLRRAAKNQLHSHSPNRMSFLILRLMRSRLRALT